ncbi:MAG: hypothetical protein CO103_02895 [Chloroflexi bacterium CG_4_9_14_3_um_filter_45_9]|nr:MAG: hypothetical protein AUK00_05545 [Dehalococcoidia bacterium CG2_30_46_9]PJB50223.1 MAG: hypothetical protein CO103_02895 [Chloroflexi bacterium CG_4_9_14_3_um_filter_45_9]
MKRHELIRELVKEGCYLRRHGKKHDIYINPKSGKKAPVPRHSEIKESLCELIRRQLGLKGLSCKKLLGSLVQTAAAASQCTKRQRQLLRSFGGWYEIQRRF